MSEAAAECCMDRKSALGPDTVHKLLDLLYASHFFPDLPHHRMHWPNSLLVS